MLRSQYIPMQLNIDAGNLSTRRNTYMRSLTLEYPRVNPGNHFSAELVDLQKVDHSIRLKLLSSDTTGIELKFPQWLTGMFYLKVQDGEQSFVRKIAIQ